MCKQIWNLTSILLFPAVFWLQGAICVIHACRNMWISELSWKTNPTFLHQVTDWDVRGQAYWIFLLFTHPSHTQTLNEPSPLWKVKNLCCTALTVTARFPRARLHDCHCLVLRQSLLAGWPPAATLGQPGLPQPLHYCCSQEQAASSSPVFVWIGRIPYEGACRDLFALSPPHQDYFSYTSQHKITTQPSVEEMLFCTLIQKQA